MREVSRYNLADTKLARLPLLSAAAMTFALLEPTLNRASDGLENIVAKALRRAPAGECALLAWPIACGSAVADRTRPVSFSDGVLRVEVADAGWRRELSDLAPRYVAAINKYSATRVKRIEFVVKGTFVDR